MSMNIDDMPVGNSGGGGEEAENPFGLPDEQPPAAPKEDESKKPLEERLVSKKWNTKAEAFEELATELKTSEGSDLLYQYMESVKKFLLEKHPSSLEKVLLFFTEFIKKCSQSQATENQADWITALINNGVSHTRPKIKETALECIAEIVATSEEFNELAEPLAKLMKQSNPKVNSFS